MGQSRGQICLGSEDFRRDALQAVATVPGQAEIPRAQRRPAAWPLAHYRNTYPERDAAILAAFATGAYTQQEIAQYFGLHYSTVSRVIRRKTA